MKHLLILCWTGLLLTTACKKPVEDRVLSSNPSEFFETVAPLPDVVERIRIEIARQNEQARFVSRLMTSEGIPRWESADISLRDDRELAARQSKTTMTDTLVVIPLVLKGDSKVNSFLACKVNGADIKINLIKGRRYALYGFEGDLNTKSAESLAFEIMHLNHLVFGDTLFRITDPRLFNVNRDSNQRYLKFPPKPSSVVRNSQRASGYITITTCATVVYDGDRGQLLGVPPGGSLDYYHSYETCSSTTYWFFDSPMPSPPPVQTADPYSGGGGTAGGGAQPSPWYDSDPCSGGTGLPVTYDVQGDGSCGGIAGWQTLNPIATQLNKGLGPEDYYYFDSRVPPNAQHFGTVAEFQAMLARFTPETYVNTQDQREPVVHFRANLTFVAGVDIAVKLEKGTNGVYSVKEVSSDTWGATLRAWSWTQSGFSVSTNGSTITLVVTGHEVYYILIGGIGAVYSKKRDYELQINNLNAKPMSFKRLN